MKKKINTNSNTYILVYSAVLVVVVAFLLAFIYQSLKAMQDANVALDKKKQILAALNIRNLSDDEAKQTYAEVIDADRIINEKGNVIVQGEKGGEQAAFKLKSSDAKEGKLALYICTVNGQTKYVIPVYGMGLWGSIWGYVAVDDDLNTVFGAYFDHESETAGLGAEIKDSKQWQDQFKGKHLFQSGSDEVKLQVLKKSDVSGPTTQCDAVTGATLTSDGVSLMLTTSLSRYRAFLKQNNNVKEAQ